VLLRSLRDLRRGFGWWSLGLVGLVAMQVSVYPTVRDDPGFSELTENYPEVLKELFGFGGSFDYTSPAGYLGVELFSLIVPLLLIIAAVATGAGAIAGEEDRGTLDLLMSLPLTRRRMAAEKLAAMAAEVVGLGLVLLVSLAIGVRVIDMGVPLAHLTAVTLAAVLLAMGFGAIALLIGAATGSKGAAIGVTAALAVAGYLVNSLAALVSELETAQRFTPFYHYSAPDPLRAGFSGWHLVALLAVVVVASAAALVAVDRRDLRS
jgi:beta-exotoxin I transport system permease protein